MTLGGRMDQVVKFPMTITGILLLSLLSTLAHGSVLINDFETNWMTGLPTTGEYNAIAVGDIDGDGDPDIAFGGEDYSTSSTTGLKVYTGNGKGTWTSASTGLPTVDSWGGLAMGDADKDGNMELYATNEGWGSHSGAIKGLGAWEYSAGSWSTTGISSPWTTDTTNDAKLVNISSGPSLDLAITSSLDNKGIKVFNGSGSSPITWTEFSKGLPTTNEWTGISAYDMNNDGSKDLAAGSYSSKGVRLYLQGSSGWTEVTSTTLPSTSNYGGVEMGDVDNDGNGDILFASSGGGVKLLLGNGGGIDGKSFSWTDVTSKLPGSLTGSSGITYQLSLADIEGDGDLDLLVPKYNSASYKGLRLYLGNGTVASGTNFRFTEVMNKKLPTTGNYVGSAFLDMDRDGILDVAGASFGSGVKVYRSNFTVIDPNNKPPVPIIVGGGNITIGGSLGLEGNRSYDQEDCLQGDTNGNILTYEWNLSKKPAKSKLNDNSLKTVASKAFVNVTPDVEGTYEITLAVKDRGMKWSNKGTEARTTIRCTNGAPVPDAGDNVTVYVMEKAYLNGSASTDPDGHPIVFDWNITVIPSGSMIRDSSLKPDDRSPAAYFKPDLPGRYELTLAVKDAFGKWSAKVDSVTVRSEKYNLPPVARAGQDTSVYLGDVVILNGTGSHDPDGIIVEYNWTCTTKIVALVNSTTATPSFVPNETGTYDLSLKVRDDNDSWSLIDLVRVNVVSVGTNLPPISNAGDDISVIQGETVALNGTGSYDPDGTISVWEWTTGLSLNDSGTDRPWFLSTEPGEWIITLRVMDDNMTWSDPDEVIVTVTERYINRQPVANAGQDLTVQVGDPLTLNGSASFDPDGNLTGYAWTCIGRTLTIEQKAVVDLTLQEAGTYSFSLIVTDDESAVSAPDMVNVSVTERPLPPVKNVTPTLGPFKTQLGSIVSGATVYLVSGALNFTVTAVTDAQGNANFSQGIPPGNYTMTVVTGDKTLLQGIGVWIKDDGKVVYHGGSLPWIIEEVPKVPSDKDGRGWILVVIAVIVMAVLAAVSITVFLLARSKRTTATVGSACPVCGIEMVLKDDDGNFYCAMCKRTDVQEGPLSETAPVQDGPEE